MIRASVCLLFCLSCTPSYRRCPEPKTPATPARVPARLSETGLYRDLRAGTLAEGVVPFRPEFELWSDGATKRRWIALPAGQQIDATDMNAWQFPTGTKLWKEFTRDGVRVETRLLEKVGPAPEDWLPLTFVWASDGSDAHAISKGQADANGTPHDVPATRECFGCHGGTEARVLGFSAIQLNHAAPPDEWSLQRLEAEGRLRGSTPVPPIPGDAETRSALGYLHANCSHCHNQHRPPETGGQRCFNPRRDFDLSLRTDALDSAESTATYRTAMVRLIVPGASEKSPLYKRARGDLPQFQARMPPLATEVLDPKLLPMLDAWIRKLPKSGGPATH